jgi:hypothetical protein
MVGRLYDQAFSHTRRDPLVTPAALQKAALFGGSPGWRHERTFAPKVAMYKYTVQTII